MNLARQNVTPVYRNAADPTAYFCIPPNRVVELGTQIEL